MRETDYGHLDFQIVPGVAERCFAYHRMGYGG